MVNRRLLVDVSLLVLFTVISSNFACKCDVSGRDNPEFLCDFDYVLHGEVVRERIAGSNASVQEHERIYTVKVNEMYKGREYISSYVELHTSYYSTACGITLELQKSYVIAGSISATHLRAYSCGWNVQWGSVKDSFKKYFPKLKDCSESSHFGACSCAKVKWTPQDLCGRDFVLHGDVEGDRLIGNASTPEQQTRIYTVKVKEILRGLERIKGISRSQNTSYVEIHTSPNDGPCGITLNLNETYVITGSIENHKLNSYLCSDWNTKWQDIPSSFREFFPKLATCAANAINASGVLLLSILLLAFRMTA